MTSTPVLLADARTFLFVPGNRPERFQKAAQSGADVVILDLEDSVPAADKAAARAAIDAAWPGLRAHGVPVMIRINAIDQPAGLKDLRWIAALESAPAGVMVPKAESRAALERAGAAVAGLPLIPLIESAAGHAAVSDIAAAEGVVRLAVGHIDFMADTGLQCAEDEAELVPLRFAVAMATRLSRRAPAIDGVTVGVNDDARLLTDVRRAVRFGFGAKLCIHPRQVPVVHAALAPSDAELDWARRVVEADAASGGAAVQLDGRMVDLPVVLQARRLLARARSSESAA